MDATALGLDLLAEEATAPAAAEGHPLAPAADAALGLGLLAEAALPEAAATERPPASPAAIGDWLRGYGYREWSAPSQATPTGERGGARILLNQALSASLAADAPRHPIGAAAVRELYEADLETLKGLALMVKVGDGDGNAEEGGAWLWYETFAVAEAGPPTVAERGAPGCVGCHAAGVDMFLRPGASTAMDD
ncbi:MAG: hypothetical protein R3A79_13195 [Nannocystaceae bacterium]